MNKVYLYLPQWFATEDERVVNRMHISKRVKALYRDRALRRLEEHVNISCKGYVNHPNDPIAKKWFIDALHELVARRRDNRRVYCNFHLGEWQYYFSAFE